MSRLRLSFMVGLSVLVLFWASTALWVHFIRLSHRSLIASIRSMNASPAKDYLDLAIADYTAALVFTPCNLALHNDYILLVAHRADASLAKTDSDASDAALKQMRHALSAKVTCAPNDGKAWLDLATTNLLLEGFGPSVIDAIAKSAQVAPGESWLALKRLKFLLPFLPVLDERLHTIAQHDLDVLERGHPIRLKELRKSATVNSNKSLRVLFSTQTPQK